MWEFIRKQTAYNRYFAQNKKSRRVIIITNHAPMRELNTAGADIESAPEKRQKIYPNL